jgi:hypothetical protein
MRISHQTNKLTHPNPTEPNPNNTLGNQLTLTTTESVVEATPSSVVQLAAIFLSPALGFSPVNVASIMLSTFVIASKGYLLSYSIYAATFAFNCFCIAFDVFSLFAVATWLMHAFLTSPLGPTGLEWAMAGMLVIGGGLIGVAGFAVMWFANFDDHCKVGEREQDV